MNELYNVNDIWWRDVFELYDDHGYWLYYNIDGNDGNGQIVEVCFYATDILLDAEDEDEFWDHLSSVGSVYLHDNGDEDYYEYVNELLDNSENTDVHRSGITITTVQWLIDWAKKYI